MKSTIISLLLITTSSLAIAEDTSQVSFPEVGKAYRITYSSAQAVWDNSTNQNKLTTQTIAIKVSKIQDNGWIYANHLRQQPITEETEIDGKKVLLQTGKVKYEEGYSSWYNLAAFSQAHEINLEN